MSIINGARTPHGSPGDRPQGNVPVIVRLALDDGTELWRPGRANRWRDGCVLVIWENIIGNGWSSQSAWLHERDVTRAIAGPSELLTPQWRELPRWTTGAGH
ncbi:hypothetical protein BRM3_14910 (plasmid) [Brachybacterium huguangmaarense]|uniref:Uncharacterized protein n=1 Tax=Brachybacterium huguangmaarense TaxID=1652028 RepID=A0ABY6G520_9MICO|nr:hypothetical protein [Brachybacterium huguangmaarense]UYG18314.1 hypothetical protein BRM3_14910 [Brachybacterium huguangmaarense]